MKIILKYILTNIQERKVRTAVMLLSILLSAMPRQFHKNPRKRQLLKERRDHDRIEKREKSHERYYNET